MGVGEKGAFDTKILHNLEKSQQNISDPSAGKPNLGVPSGSVTLRGVPRRPIVLSVVTHFAPFGVWVFGKGALEA